MSENGQGQGETLRTLLSMCTAEVENSLLVLHQLGNVGDCVSNMLLIFCLLFRYTKILLGIRFNASHSNSSQEVLNTTLQFSRPSLIVDMHSCFARYGGSHLPY